MFNFTLKGRLATDNEIETYHSKHLIEKMRTSETMDRNELMKLSKEYSYMYWHNASDKAARYINLKN